MQNERRMDLNTFTQIWLEQTASVMSQVSSRTWTATLDANAQPSASSEIALCFSLAKGLAGGVALRMAAADAVRMSRQFTGIPYADEATLENDDREALVELVRQIAGVVASAIKAFVGEVDLSGGEPVQAPWQAVAVHRMKLRCDADEITIELALNSTLVEALAPKPTSEPARSVVHEYVQQGNLDLLMDVELGVTLRFGQRQMLLREILDLSSGAVVELDRQVQEPVDLLLDDKLIARGEVVIINGNYGLRVTEVAPASQRIGSIN